MTIEIFDNYNKLSAALAAHILCVVQRSPEAVLCLAAGDTPRLAYRMLVENASIQNVDFSNCTFIGLDEWVGIPPENPGSCSFFLNENLFVPLGIPTHRVHLFDGLSGDLSSECENMDAIIATRGGIDLMVAGVGMNGHIGFNEPNVPEDRHSHVVALDATTQRVGQKYFKETAKLAYGITLGMRHLFESGTAILIASGSGKADIVRRALEGPVSMDVPASLIRKHRDGIVMLDRDAAHALPK